MQNKADNNNNQSLVVLKCTYCQSSLGNVSIICAKCFDFNLCLKVSFILLTHNS